MVPSIAEIHSLMVLSAGKQTPWATDESSFVEGKLSNISVGLPITWIDFAQNSTQTGLNKQLQSLLLDAGCDLEDIRTMEQEPDLKTCADLIATWVRKNF